MTADARKNLRDRKRRRMKLERPAKIQKQLQRTRRLSTKETPTCVS